MERAFICGGEKYTISPTNTIALPISVSDLPNEIVVDGDKLFLKASFHVSLVCINEIIKKYSVSIPDFRDLVLKDFCEFTASNDIKVLNYGEFKFSFQDDLKTVIVMCEVSNLSKFFEILNQKFNLNIEYPPTHITLYSHNGKSGIFLTDSHDINNLTKPIPNPIGRQL